MMLFLRYQVEEYAFSDKKWKSPEALDAEFERREIEKKNKKEKKFKQKLNELKKTTKSEAWRKSLKNGGVGGKFGDRVGEGRHVHEWGNPVEREEGISISTCVECGHEREEMVF
jgi:DNA-repair protein complementing XP-A cells